MKKLSTPFNAATYYNNRLDNYLPVAKGHFPNHYNFCIEEVGGSKEGSLKLINIIRNWLPLERTFTRQNDFMTFTIIGQEVNIIFHLYMNDNIAIKIVDAKKWRTIKQYKLLMDLNCVCICEIYKKYLLNKKHMIQYGVIFSHDYTYQN